METGRFEIRWPDSINITREPVRFDTYGCYRAAFAVGVGMTSGVCAVFGLAVLLHCIVQVLFA